MITQAMILFAIKLNLFSIMQLSLERYGKAHEKNFTKNWVYNIYLIEDGAEDYVSFTKLLTIKLLLILKLLFHQKELLLIDYELVRYIVHLLPETNDFNLHFSNIAYLNGIYSIQNFKILFLYRPSNVHYYFLFASVHYLFILSIILED